MSGAETSRLPRFGFLANVVGSKSHRHSPLLSLASRYGHLIGFVKGRQALTVSVNPPSILGNGATGSVDVTVTGAKASRKLPRGNGAAGNAGGGSAGDDD